MIENIWILTKSGILLYSKDYVKLRTEDDLLAGFLSALDSFITETTQQGIKSISMKNKKFNYLISNNYNLIIVINSNISDNNTLIHRLLLKISSKFIELYKKYIINFSGMTVIFNDFDPILEEVVSDSEIFAKCDTCKKIILEDLITKEIGEEIFYFCCSRCEKEFEYDKHFGDEIRLKLESKHLFCPICKIKKPLPLHCHKPMHLEKINEFNKLVCWMGKDCRILDPPLHCGKLMEIH